MIVTIFTGMNGHKIVNQDGLHFITPTVVGWIDVFTRSTYRQIIVDSLNYCIKHKGLQLYAYVIMSNHIHLVVSASQGHRLSDIIRDFKSYTASYILKEVENNPKESRSVWMLKLFKYYAKYNKNNTTYQLWQRGNHPIELASDKWIVQKLQYIHQNPVRAGLVAHAEEYVYSSARDYAGSNGPIEVQKIDFSLLG